MVAPMMVVVPVVMPPPVMMMVVPEVVPPPVVVMVPVVVPPVMVPATPVHLLHERFLSHVGLRRQRSRRYRSQKGRRRDNGCAQRQFHEHLAYPFQVERVVHPPGARH